MDRRTLIDEIDALANGTLASEDAGRLRERCAADPELRALLETYLEVHAMTEGLVSDVPPCRLAIEEVESTLASRQAWRVVLRRSLRIAAAVLVLVVGGLVLSRVVTALRGAPGTGRSTVAVALEAIPVDAEAVPAVSVETPEFLASFRPVENGKIHWIDSLGAARTMARLASRPVLLFIFHPTCPYCRQMDDQTFTDPSVLSRLDGFVPLRLNVMTLDPSLQPLLKEGWPWLGAVTAGGETLLAFPGLRGPGDLASRLDEASRRAGPPVASWERVHEIARRFADAAKAERAGRLADAWHGYARLKADETAGPFCGAAALGLRRIAQTARRALVTARDLATSPAGAGTALSTLDEWRARLADTPPGDDLDHVRARLAADGKFPPVRGFTEKNGD